MKVLSGTLRPDREPRLPATPRDGRAQPPRWFPSAERRVFRRLTDEVERTGTPSASFVDTIAGAALQVVAIQRYSHMLISKGDTYETATSTGALKIAVRPEVHLRNSALRLLRGFLVELGLTPAALGRIDRSAIPKNAKKDPKLDFLLGARRERYFGRERGAGA